MSAKIPKFGDKEMQSTDVVVRPSTERMPFTSAGELKNDGPGPLHEVRFYEAPDLDKLPQWKRTRGNEWTDAAFRKIVREWLIDFFITRPWARAWDVTEVASSVRSSLRLSEDHVYLVIGIVDASKRRFETSAIFPPTARDQQGALVVLAMSAKILDVLHGG